MSQKEIVLPGYKVEIELVDRLGESERMSVQIVPDALADLARGYLGESTPLCQAIYGREAGSEVAYPLGELRAVRILTVTATEERPDPGAAERREQAMRAAVEQSERTNAILFASSFNGKWGDYDPSSLLDEDK